MAMLKQATVERLKENTKELAPNVNPDTRVNAVLDKLSTDTVLPDGKTVIARIYRDGKTGEFLFETVKDKEWKEYAFALLGMMAEREQILKGVN